MLYRLRPPTTLEWSGFPGFDTFETARENQLDFDRLDWKPTESLHFSQDLLRIAVRHGVLSPTGLVLDAQHTIDLGRADELDTDIRPSTERGALKAAADLEADLTAPAQKDLAAHWTRLGGTLPTC